MAESPAVPGFEVHWARGRFNALFFGLMGPYLNWTLRAHKRRVFDHLPQRVVEIGSGVGANLRYLPAEATLVAIEPNPHMHGRLRTAERVARECVSNSTTMSVSRHRSPRSKCRRRDLLTRVVQCDRPSSRPGRDHSHPAPRWALQLRRTRRRTRRYPHPGLPADVPSSVGLGLRRMFLRTRSRIPRSELPASLLSTSSGIEFTLR